MDPQAPDPNKEMMVETMRREARCSLVHRRHEELRRQCEKEVTSYETAKKLMAAECRRSQVQLLNRLKTLLHYSSRQRETRRHSQASSSLLPPRSDVSNMTSDTTRHHRHGDDDGVSFVLGGRRHTYHDSSIILSDVDRIVGSRKSSVRGGGGGMSNGVCDGDRGKGKGRRAVSAPVSALSYKSHHTTFSSSSSTFSRFTGRERLLFRVTWQNGKEVYVRDQSQQARDESRVLSNGGAPGCDNDDVRRSKCAAAVVQRTSTPRSNRL